jgi:hypothetical protein
VPTVASRALLVTYDWPEDSVQYKRLTKFIDTFFSKINEFSDPARHPKWDEVNLAADIPGWTRFKPAADWIAAHRTKAEVAELPTKNAFADVPSAGLRQAFEEFLQTYTATSVPQLKKLSSSERDKLFAQFMGYFQSQKKTDKSRMNSNAPVLREFGSGDGTDKR